MFRVLIYFQCGRIRVRSKQPKNYSKQFQIVTRTISKVFQVSRCGDVLLRIFANSMKSDCSKVNLESHTTFRVLFDAFRLIYVCILSIWIRGMNAKLFAGLPISSYFSAVKIKWLIDNVPAVAKAFAAKTCVVGTIDTWLIWVHKKTFYNRIMNTIETIIIAIIQFFVEFDWWFQWRFAPYRCDKCKPNVSNESGYTWMGRSMYSINFNASSKNWLASSL